MYGPEVHVLLRLPVEIRLDIYGSILDILLSRTGLRCLAHSDQSDLTILVNLALTCKAIFIEVLPIIHANTSFNIPIPVTSSNPLRTLRSLVSSKQYTPLSGPPPPASSPLLTFPYFEPPPFPTTPALYLKNLTLHFPPPPKKRCASFRRNAHHQIDTTAVGSSFPSTHHLPRIIHYLAKHFPALQHLTIRVASFTDIFHEPPAPGTIPTPHYWIVKPLCCYSRLLRSVMFTTDTAVRLQGLLDKYKRDDLHVRMIRSPEARERGLWFSSLGGLFSRGLAENGDELVSRAEWAGQKLGRDVRIWDEDEGCLVCNAEDREEFVRDLMGLRTGRSERGLGEKRTRYDLRGREV